MPPTHHDCQRPWCTLLEVSAGKRTSAAQLQQVVWQSVSAAMFCDTCTVQLASAPPVCWVNDTLSSWVVCVCSQLQLKHFLLFVTLDKQVMHA